MCWVEMATFRYGYRLDIIEKKINLILNEMENTRIGFGCPIFIIFSYILYLRYIYNICYIFSINCTVWKLQFCIGHGTLKIMGWILILADSQGVCIVLETKKWYCAISTSEQRKDQRPGTCFIFNEFYRVYSQDLLQYDERKKKKALNQFTHLSLKWNI